MKNLIAGSPGSGTTIGFGERTMPDNMDAYGHDRVQYSE